MIKGISFVLGLSMVCGAVACNSEVGSLDPTTADGTAGASGSVDTSTSDLSWRWRRGTGGTVASTGGTVTSTGGTVASTGGTKATGGTGGTVVASTGGTKATGGTGGTTAPGGTTAVACPAAAPATAPLYNACDCATG